MSELTISNSVSLLTLILPKESVDLVSKAISNKGAKGIVQISARGSVLNEGGFLQKMFPPPAPEQQLLQALVPNSKIEEISDIAIEVGNLDKVGSGAVFTISCNDAHFSKGFPTNIVSSDEESDTVMSGNLEAICCICEIGVADDIAKAALQNGAPGPTVTFGEGGGIRDKIPILRITKGTRKRICLVCSGKD